MNDNKIIMISVDKIEPHPDNPRKELGDLAELAASIKAKGILQNLTVVPWFPAGTADDTVLQESADEAMEGYYRVVIGHRRLAAAQLAGLAEVPCVVAHMTRQEQVETMLLENLQRSDLTPFEQAEGFQMMMDFGDSVEVIAEKTGFSQSTIRRKLKLTELDADKLKRAGEKQITFIELERLSKIEDTKVRNAVLAEYGTRNYENKYQQAINAQEDQKNISRWREIFARRGITEIPGKECWSSSYEACGYISLGDEEEKLDEKIKDGRTYYFCLYYGTFYLRADKEVCDQEDEEPTPEELERERREAAENARRDELKEAAERAYGLRRGFIKNFHVADAERIKGQITELLVRSAVRWGELCYETDELCEVMGIPLPEEWDDEMMQPEISAYSERNPGKALLCLLYIGNGDGKNQHYYDWRGEYCSDNDELDYLYDLLDRLGYEISDEESQLRNGTHRLYQKEDE